MHDCSLRGNAPDMDIAELLTEEEDEESSLG